MVVTFSWPTLQRSHCLGRPRVATLSTYIDSDFPASNPIIRIAMYKYVDL